MVRPNGPVLVQRSFHSDQYNTSIRSSCPVGLRRATSGSFGTILNRTGFVGGSNS